MENRLVISVSKRWGLRGGNRRGRWVQNGKMSDLCGVGTVLTIVVDMNMEGKTVLVLKYTHYECK